jgi:hypothetical protein
MLISGFASQPNTTMKLLFSRLSGSSILNPHFTHRCILPHQCPPVPSYPPSSPLTRPPSPASPHSHQLYRPAPRPRNPTPTATTSTSKALKTCDPLHPCLPILWSSIPSPRLNPKRFFTATVSLSAMSYGGYRNAMNLSSQVGSATTGRRCVYVWKPYLPW